MNIFALFFRSAGEISISLIDFFARQQDDTSIQAYYKQKHNPSEQPTSF